ncbi:hypothetical protein B6S12_07670 [Helicobacter valdiviensis]|uniref:Uncharacterized protein n=1 Tax=Helicobacter valdiviensis TaxID=1458358 RepID=A0A2W6MUV4_9HELI|nr:hypothetical protein [Helicobacter valdiviensis]PZT47731.1 hypothetical protein B6S12_07670 [Helicobacter valdiviensis]
MKAKIAIMHLRSKLRDTDLKNPRFSNAELLSALENSQNKLICEFENNICHFVFKDNQRLLLPFSALGLIEAKLNGATLDFKPHSVIIKGEKGKYLYALNPKEYKLSTSYQGTLELYVNCASILEKEEDTIFLDGMFLNALLYGALILILQVETSVNTFEKISFYENLYKKECAFLRSLTNKQREKSAILTPFIKV